MYTFGWLELNAWAQVNIKKYLLKYEIFPSNLNVSYEMESFFVD